MRQAGSVAMERTCCRTRVGADTREPVGKRAGWVNVGGERCRVWALCGGSNSGGVARVGKIVELRFSGGRRVSSVVRLNFRVAAVPAAARICVERDARVVWGCARGAGKCVVEGRRVLSEAGHIAQEEAVGAGGGLAVEIALTPGGRVDLGRTGKGWGHGRAEVGVGRISGDRGHGNRRVGVRRGVGAV